MKKLVFAVAVFLTSAAGFAQNAVLRVAIDASYEPFTFKTADGKPTGFDVDIANALCDQIKRKCDFVEQPWDGMIPGLLAKKYDVIISSMSITEDRLKQVNFTDKYYNTPTRIVMKKDVKIGEDFSGVKGKRIGVLKGSTQEKFANEILRKAGAIISSYDAQDLVYLDIKSGRIEGTVTDQVEATFGLLKRPEGKDYAFTGPDLSGKKYETLLGVGVGVAHRKGENQLTKELNAAIKAIRSNGVYTKLAAKYFDFDVYGK